MRLPMSEVPGRRSDQFGDFVGMLELGAIDLDASAAVSKQSFGHGLDHTRLARSGGPEKQQVSHGTSRRIQSRQEHLIDLHYLFDCLVLSHDPATKGAFEFSGIVASAVRVEYCGEIRSHKLLSVPDISLSAVASARTTIYENESRHSTRPEPQKQRCR